MMMFEEFFKKEVKCCYKDFDQNKIARGKLVEINNGLIKITGRLGTIIIRDTQVMKMGLLKKNEG
jgi:hypothetical protein